MLVVPVVVEFVRASHHTEQNQHRAEARKQRRPLVQEDKSQQQRNRGREDADEAEARHAQPLQQGEVGQERHDAPGQRQVRDRGPCRRFARQPESLTREHRRREQRRRADQHRRRVERSRVQRGAVPLRGHASRRGAGRACDDRRHRPCLGRIDAHVLAKKRDDAEEGEERAAELAGRDAVAGKIDVGHADGDERQGREQDGRQPAVEELLTPVDQTEVDPEQHDPDKGDEDPLAAAVRPPRAESRDQRHEHQAGDEEPESPRR